MQNTLWLMAFNIYQLFFNIYNHFQKEIPILYDVLTFDTWFHRRSVVADVCKQPHINAGPIADMM